jgi:hypothetical protein
MTWNVSGYELDLELELELERWVEIINPIVVGSGRLDVRMCVGNRH